MIYEMRDAGMWVYEWLGLIFLLGMLGYSIFLPYVVYYMYRVEQRSLNKNER